MPESRHPISARGRSPRTDLGGLAADVKHERLLKCFEQSFAMSLLAGLIEFTLGRAVFAEVRPWRPVSAGRGSPDRMSPVPGT
jgi:hypothetical protein